ncbi:MAG: hypothetical protein ABS45_04245 [Comamonas sp. SCN 65-56]|uniref:hypothetical protein n=1 Tax=Comamonas sp. SCN 65-56 TaxID=1660095 RepID=UPI000868639B|nr:hypothetical protein [Comamonas sp. SCN 65-56]ODS93106.1 MAG: hypothetical protein ABS45_04245 [Comamonas sp. SCN 65-56]
MIAPIFRTPPPGCRGGDVFALSGKMAGAEFEENRAPTHIQQTLAATKNIVIGTQHQRFTQDALEADRPAPLVPKQVA